jgi:predicted component of type VI protein secretion system
MLSVTITGPGRKREVLEFDQPELTVGRHAENDIVLPQNNISKVHARIRKGGQGAIVVIDNDSTNGTVINGKKISAPTTLQPGDKVLVGDNVIEVAAGSGGTGKRVLVPPASAPKHEAASNRRDTTRSESRLEPTPMSLVPRASESSPADASAGNPAGIPSAIPSFDDDWDKMEPVDPAVAHVGQKAVFKEPDWDLPDTKRKPSSREKVSPSDPGAPDDAVAKATALAECLRQYVEIDEFHQVRATGKACQCGECLLCRSKVALGE